MKRTIIVAVVAGFIAIFNGWIAELISPAFRIPESVAEDVADKIEAVDLAKEAVSVVQTEPATVTRVIDGDTVEVTLLSGETALVRYVGIDTPEKATDQKAEECFYNEAKNLNKELVEGLQVRLKRDVSDVDKYGRLLRYVYVGDEFINQKLVALGAGTVIRVEPDTANYEMLKQVEDEAKAGKVGMWSLCAN